MGGGRWKRIERRKLEADMGGVYVGKNLQEDTRGRCARRKLDDDVGGGCLRSRLEAGRGVRGLS